MTLDEQYQKTIDDQRTHLLQLQEEFNAECDKAKVRAQEKIKALAPGDKEGREAALKEQKEELNAALSQLKISIDTSTRHTMRTLESIITQKEQEILKDMEKQIEAL